MPGTRIPPTLGTEFRSDLAADLAGPATVATYRWAVVAAHLPFDRPLINAAFDRLYAGDDSLSRAYHEGLASTRR